MIGRSGGEAAPMRSTRAPGRSRALPLSSRQQIPPGTAFGTQQPNGTTASTQVLVCGARRHRNQWGWTMDPLSVIAAISRRSGRPSCRSIPRKPFLEAIAFLTAILVATSHRSRCSVAAHWPAASVQMTDASVGQQAHSQEYSSPVTGRPKEGQGAVVHVSLRHAVADHDTPLSEPEGPDRRVVPAGLRSPDQWKPIDWASWPCLTGPVGMV